MIRRDIANAGKSEWLIISQREHAALAGDLASRWTAEPLASWPWREELLAAVYRHDDGWSEWDALPDVSRETGAPLDFLETPLKDVLPIWRDSIAAAEEVGVLAAWVVSGHFDALLRRGLASRPQTNGQNEADAFLAEQNAHRAEWFADWSEAAPQSRTREAADLSLCYLQMFDWLSLWLCCAERTAPEIVEAPGLNRLQFTPIAPSRIAVSPWPFEPPPLYVQVSGRAIPAVFYSDAEAARRAVSRMATLAWTLAPGDA